MITKQENKQVVALFVCLLFAWYDFWLFVAWINF